MPYPPPPHHSFFHINNLQQAFNTKRNLFNQNNLNQEPTEIKVSIQEYLKGCTKKITKHVINECLCESLLCYSCAGSGFSIPTLEVCMDCVGEGYTKNCGKCTNGKIKAQEEHQIIIPQRCKKVGNYKVVMDSDEYSINDQNRVTKQFNIRLKESLIGFTKDFIDPFGTHHFVCVSGVIVTTGDAYSVNTQYGKIYLIFNVVVPESLPQNVIEVLQGLEF
jgi:hypothetical protein